MYDLVPYCYLGLRGLPAEFITVSPLNTVNIMFCVVKRQSSAYNFYFKSLWILMQTLN